MIPPSKDRERLTKRSENRYRFLRAVYDATGGAQRAFVNMWDLGEQLRLSREETNDAMEYLRGEGLLKPTTLGGGISITHAGVVEVEESIARPDEATDHFTVQVINNYHGPFVSQHGDGNTATLGNTSVATISNSSVGAANVGGSIQSSEAPVAKADFDSVIAAAQKTLVDDDARLTEIANGLSDGLWQVLRRLCSSSLMSRPLRTSNRR